jgi:hypothetical protein
MYGSGRAKVREIPISAGGLRTTPLGGRRLAPDDVRQPEAAGDPGRTLANGQIVAADVSADN